MKIYRSQIGHYPVFMFPFFIAILLFGCQPKPSETENTVVKEDSTHISHAAEDLIGGDSTRAVLMRIMAAVDSNHCELLAPKVAYRGIGGDGDYKRNCDYAIPDERVMVDKICAQIKVLKSPQDSLVMGEYTFEEQKEGFWHVLQTKVVQAGGAETHVTFAFIESNGKLLLGDID